MAEFADAAFQTMFLGDGNGMTSILSRVRPSVHPLCLALRPQAIHNRNGSD